MNFPDITIKYPNKLMSYKINLLVDDQSSWITPWAEYIYKSLIKICDIRLCFSIDQVSEGDFNFLLGCTQKLSRYILKKNKMNLVIHESGLPKGRGWSPMGWQVLNGINDIPVVMFDADEKTDAGPIYMRSVIRLNGHELWDEIRHKQGQKTVEMIIEFLEKWPDIQPIQQTGEPTYFPKRSKKHDELDTRMRLSELFNHLRIVDNERYPAWFQINGHKYILKIYPCN